MNEHDQQLKIREKVLERVKRGVPMHSRAYFLVRVAISSVVSLLVLAISAYVLSFIAFSVHESGEQFLLGFGGHGIQTFFVLFPWLPALVDVALIVFLEWLLQGFKFGYRLPLVALFVIVLVASAAIAAAIYATPFNGLLLGMADRGQLPVIGQAYEQIRDSHQGNGVFRGTVTAIDGDQISISHDDGDHDVDDGSWNIVLPLGYSTSTLSVGERVYVLGTPSGPVVHADGMEELSPDQ